MKNILFLSFVCMLMLSSCAVHPLFPFICFRKQCHDEQKKHHSYYAMNKKSVRSKGQTSSRKRSGPRNKMEFAKNGSRARI